MSAADCLARAKAAAAQAVALVPEGPRVSVTVVVEGRAVTLERVDETVRPCGAPHLERERPDPLWPGEALARVLIPHHALRRVLADAALGLNVTETLAFWSLPGRRPSTAEVEDARKRARKHAPDAMTKAADLYAKGEYELAALFIDKAASRLGG